MDRITLIRGILDQKGLGRTVSEKQVLEALRTVPRRTALRLPPQVDDRRDYRVELLLLRPDQRLRLGLPPVKLTPAPTPSTPAVAIPQPVYRIRVHALVCRNDDGKYADSSKPQTIVWGLHDAA